jgi:hypothetical protein
MQILRFLKPTLLPVLFLFAGCATSRIDWNTRIGTYTYDQAILDLGPADKSANLQDGTLVAEWLTHRGSSYVQTFPGYWPSSYGPYGPYYPAYFNSYSPDYFLRLIFDPDRRLRSWKRFYK